MKSYTQIKPFARRHDIAAPFVCPKNDDPQLAIRMPWPMFAAVERISVERGISRTAVVRELIEAGLKARKASV